MFKWCLLISRFVLFLQILFTHFIICLFFFAFHEILCALIVWSFNWRVQFLFFFFFCRVWFWFFVSFQGLNLFVALFVILFCVLFLFHLTMELILGTAQRYVCIFIDLKQNLRNRGTVEEATCRILTHDE
jgi:hypothetical protein